MKIYIQSPAFNYVEALNQPKKDKEKYLYLLSLLSFKNEYRNLSSKILEKALGKNPKKGISYKAVINNLTESGVIQCDNKRKKGVKSFGYKLTDTYFNQSLVEYTLGKRLSNLVDMARTNQFNLLPEYIRIMKRNLADLTVGGLPIINKRITRSRTGRVYNYLTNIKREFRYKLLWKDTESLVEFDLAGAQPYILGLIVSAGLGFNSMDECLPDDLRQYLELCQSGQVYQYFADRLKIDISGESGRNKFKQRFYNTYFFNTQYTVVNSSPIGTIFKTDFPSIHQHIIDNFINKGKTLASHLQRVESALVIDTIYKGLVEAGIWSATIHDSIVCKESDADYVFSLINSIIRTNIIPCIIKRNDWLTIHTFENSKVGHIEGYTSTVHHCNNSKVGNIAEDRDIDSTIYVPTFSPMVDTFEMVDTVKRNKKELRKEESINRIKQAIKELEERNESISAYSIHKVSGISRRIVTKHLEAILDTVKADVYQVLENWNFADNGKITKEKIVLNTQYGLQMVNAIMKTFESIIESMNYCRTAA